MLYLVPTPIGNLDDTSPRIAEVLRTVDFILAEDTRTTGKLLKHLGITTSQISYHAHNEHHKLDDFLGMLQQGKQLALVSDAGTPAISDPGFLLVRAAKQANIEVSCLPGPTAFVPALAASGIPCDKFFFEGFLPQKKGRQTRLKYVSALPYTFVLYESPHRLVKCLGQLIEFCGPNRIACVAREISKLHEEILTKTLQELHDEYSQRPKVKGEIVIVVSGA